MSHPAHRMYVHALAAAFALLLGQGAVAGVSAGQGIPEAAVLARVDGDSVTTVHLVELLTSIGRPQPGADASEAFAPDRVLKRLIQNRLLEQEGYRIEAQDEPIVKNQVWELTRHRGMLALLDSVTADVSQPVEGEFDDVFDRENVMHRVSHIVVDSEPLARSILDSLTAGVSFEALSRRHTLDSERVEKGGDLGWGRADLYVPEFRVVLDDLSKGEFGGPVESERGWHVLLLADTRTETVGQSDPMREQLEQAAIRKRVMHKVRSYVESLKEKYGFVPNDTLLASLDYESTDPATMQSLRDSDEVLGAFPWRSLTVRALTRRIRFEHFHGIEGKPEAPEIRDRIFDEWVTELLLRHEASVLGFTKKPGLVAQADRLEREAIREVVIKMILDRPFEPTAEELESFYAENASAFVPAPRIRAVGAHLADEESARSFREKIEAGADPAWLAGRADGVVDPRPAAYADWVSPEALGIADDDVARGAVVGPYRVDQSWAVLQVTEIEPVAAPPLDQCSDRVLGMMKNRRAEEVMGEAMSRLEAQAEILIEDDAYDMIAMWIDDWRGVSTTPSGS